MKYLELATKIAKANAAVEKHFLFGIVAQRNDGTIVISTNIRTRNPMIAAHSEARILKKCDQGATLWISRIDRMGNWVMAQPCSQCSSLIRNRGVRKVHFTISNGVYGVWDVSKELKTRKEFQNKVSITYI